MPGIPTTRSILINAGSRRLLTGAAFGAAFGAILILLPTSLPAGDEKPKPPAKPPAAAPAKAPEKPAPAATEAKSDAKAKPLSFTDDDLEKYHKPQPILDDSDASDDDEAADEAGPADGAAAPATAPAGPKPPAPARAAVKTAARPNPVLGPPPTEDPLKKWHQEDALNAMRQQQIAALREKIAGLKSRLDYLNGKKEGLLNPGPPQVGRTKGNEYPPSEPPDPNKPPPPPNHKPDISPGRNVQQVGLIFPSLPEPQTDQDREDDKSMKIKDLLDKVKAEIETVEGDLKRANDDLITIETRAAGETSKP